MRGADEQPGSMFSYVSLEERVPRDHPLRAIRRRLSMPTPGLSRLTKSIDERSKTGPTVVPRPVIRWACPRAEVVVTDDERAALVRLTKRVRVNRGVAFRARIVLACIDDSDTAVARRLRTTKTTVAKWRSQFVERRLEGLYDEPRVGAPRTISDEQVEAIIVKTLETTPAGKTHWSTRSMAKAAGVSHTLVGPVWRTCRLQPHRTESFKISPDPQLVEKIRDVVGLCVAPPTNAYREASSPTRRLRVAAVPRW